MTEATRTRIAVWLWIAAATLGVLSWTLTGSVPVLGALGFAICTIALAEYLRARPR